MRKLNLLVDELLALARAESGTDTDAFFDPIGVVAPPERQDCEKKCKPCVSTAGSLRRFGLRLDVRGQQYSVTANQANDRLEPVVLEPAMAASKP